MKKLYPLFLFASLFLLSQPFNSKAQEFCPVGATWHFDYDYFSVGGYQKVECTGDTAIEGKVYKYLSRTQYYKDYSNPSSTGSSYKRKPIFLTRSQDTVFAWLNGEEQLLYRFNVSPGDKWELKGEMQDCYMTGGPDTLVVDSVGTQMIQGNSIRYIVAKYSGEGRWHYGGRIYEFIGAQSFIIPSPGPYCNSDPNESVGLRCYMDDYFGQYKFKSYNCTWVSGIEETELPSLISFQNPIHNHLEILSDNIRAIEIRSSIGALLMRSEHPKDLLDISSLPAGLLLINVSTNNSHQLYKVIKL